MQQGRRKDDYDFRDYDEYLKGFLIFLLPCHSSRLAITYHLRNEAHRDTQEGYCIILCLLVLASLRLSMNVLKARVTHHGNITASFC